jgi:hypothetical protein
VIAPREDPGDLFNGPLLNEPVMDSAKDHQQHLRTREHPDR